MSNESRLRAFGLVALLLPGLALAAPIAGPCGLCDSGMPCPSMAAAPSRDSGHGCCGSETDEAPPAPSLGSSQCDCGRDAPPATLVDSSPAQEISTSDVARDAEVVEAPVTAALVAGAGEERAPPPSPPTFLLDCVFLT